VIADRGSRIDLHSHAGRCFLAGLPAGHSMVAALGAASVAGALRAARDATMTVLALSAVADFAVLRPDPATGLRARRNFRAGEAYADYRRQLAGIREAVLEASSQPVIISHGQLSYPGIAHPRLMSVQHAAAVAEAGGLVGAWPCGSPAGPSRTSAPRSSGWPRRPARTT
jgi:hypothetical protein